MNTKSEQVSQKRIDNMAKARQAKKAKETKQNENIKSSKYFDVIEDAHDSDFEYKRCDTKKQIKPVTYVGSDDEDKSVEIQKKAKKKTKVVVESVDDYITRNDLDAFSTKLIDNYLSRSKVEPVFPIQTKPDIIKNDVQPAVNVGRKIIR